jgi:hypothetical protein
MPSQQGAVSDVDRERTHHEGTKDRDMLRTHLHLLDGQSILLRHIGTECLGPPLYRAVRRVASIRGRPDQRVERLGDGIRCASKDHAAIAHQHSSCQRALNPLLGHAFPRRKQRGSLSDFRAHTPST